MDWKNTLAAVVPGIANMVGGPLGGIAANALLGFFGIESTGDSAQDEALIGRAVQNMSPDQIVELKKLEARMAIEMKKADVDIYKADAMDRDSARKMRVAMGEKEFTLPFMSILITAGFFGSCYMLAMPHEPMANETLMNILFGSLATNFGQVVSFYFGSSAGSRRKG